MTEKEEKSHETNRPFNFGRGSRIGCFCPACFPGRIKTANNSTEAAPEAVPERLSVDCGAAVETPSEGSAGAVLSGRAPASGVKVLGKTWILSGSRSWDYGSKLGRGCQEIGEIL